MIYVRKGSVFVDVDFIFVDDVMDVILDVLKSDLFILGEMGNMSYNLLNVVVGGWFRVFVFYFIKMILESICGIYILLWVYYVNYG